jgi:hypothetical protein
MAAKMNHSKKGKQVPANGKESEPSEIRPLKPWTVMVYLAADSTLTNFAVESLKQMKAGQNDQMTNLNVVAELNLGQRNSTERYFFGDPLVRDAELHARALGEVSKSDATESIKNEMRNPLSSISSNIVMLLGPRPVGDAGTLTEFIKWSSQEYPAENYCLIIWGHGSGIDDSDPRLPDHDEQTALERDQCERFFVRRHRPLHTTDLDIPKPESKSIAFVDRPVSFLTSAGLKMALQDAQQSLLESAKKRGKPIWTLELLGMDACNMNLIELGYELREFADYLVASQDEVPDASWPYEHILRGLNKAAEPPYNSKEIQRFVRGLAQAYTNAYQDYVQQPVALSVLNLIRLRDARQDDQAPDAKIRGDYIRSVFQPLTNILERYAFDREINDAIVFARRRVRSFYTRVPATKELHTRDIYIDLIHFCKLLISFLREKSLRDRILEFIHKFTGVPSDKGQPHKAAPYGSHILSVNESTRSEFECNGTSIYFPTNLQDAFGNFYDQLEFARDTDWPEFVSGFLTRNPDLFITPQLDLRDAHSKGNGNGNGTMTKGNPDNGTKGNPDNGTKIFNRMIGPGALPPAANHVSDEKVNLTIYNLLYNHDATVDVVPPANLDGE